MALTASPVVLFIIIGAFSYVVQSQDNSNFRVFRGAEEESQLAGFTPMERLAIAAKFGETQVVRLTGASQSAVVQEGVSLSLDCLPWLRLFPNESIRWTFVQLDEFDKVEDPTDAPHPLAPNTDVMPPERIIVGGQFNRWLNITRTVNIQGAEDPDSKIFMCEVCIARGTPFEECNTTNYTSRVIGAPPVISSSSRDFCVTYATQRLQELDCDVLIYSPTPIPNPQRTWMRNNDVVYTAELGAAPDASEFIMNNTILMPGVLDPQTFTVLSDGQIFFTYQVENISAPGMIPDVMSTEAAERILFNLLLGTWTCSASNELGSDSITYTIRECGVCGDDNIIAIITKSLHSPVFGRDYSFRCELHTNLSEYEVAIMTYTWRKNNLVIQNENENRLIFSPLRLSDAGEYTCEIICNSSVRRIQSDPVQIDLKLPQPTVNLVSTSPNPIISGDSLTLVCSVEFREVVDIPLPESITVTWTGPDKSIIGSDHPTQLTFTRYLSEMTFDLVTRSHQGEYTCTVSIGTMKEVSASANVVIIDGMFQLSLKTINICEQWYSKSYYVSNEYSPVIKAALFEAIERRCLCHFPINHLPQDYFHCVDSPHVMTYRSTLLETHNFNASEIIGFIQDWVSADPLITIGESQVRVQSSCPVDISSLTELECV